MGGRLRPLRVPYVHRRGWRVTARFKLLVEELAREAYKTRLVDESKATYDNGLSSALTRQEWLRREILRLVEDEYE